MPLTKLTARKLNPEELQELISEVTRPLKQLRGLTKIILFGSTLRAGFSEASDLDFVLIFKSKEEAKGAQKEVYRVHSGKWPCDFICVDNATYEERSDLGGICHVAKHEGKTIYPPWKPRRTVSQKI